MPRWTAFILALFTWLIVIAMHRYGWQKGPLGFWN